MPKGKNRETIAIDFDGVIHAYSKGWHDGTAYDPPMKDAILYIKKLMEDYTVYVFSTRAPEEIQDWFGRWGEQIPTQIIQPDQIYWTTVGVLGIARHKVVAYVWLDDRALRFEGNWERAYMSIKNIIAVQPIAHDGNTSDGYHTFDELYRFRLLYNAALFNSWYEQRLYKVHKSKHHSDAPYEPIFGGGWFVVVAELPSGQISNHYEMKDWDLFKIQETPVAHAWDGHSPQDVAERLDKWLRGDWDEFGVHRDMGEGFTHHGRPEECCDAKSA